MSQAPRTRIMHVGVCVADMDRATDFYAKALGFEVRSRHQVGEAYSEVMGVPKPLNFRSQFLFKDGITVELLCFDEPGCNGTTEPRPMNQRGFTHFCVSVEDIDAVAARIVEQGGAIVPGTRKRIDGANGWFQDVVFCADPDGTRLEVTVIANWGLDAKP